MWLAEQTQDLIERTMASDQGASYRGLLKKHLPLADDAYDQDTFPFRSHLGASMIGRDCARQLWYSFRWVKRPNFSGRMLRLFNRGHLEEPRMVSMLEMIGIQFWQLDNNGKQFRISGYKKHFGGSMDGVGLGIPELVGIPFLCEMKTSAEKYFNKLIKSGVQNEKYEHYVQMNLYMGKNNLTHALYIVTNKNTDHIHMEIIKFDLEVYNKYLDRSAMIIDANEPTPRISKNPGWYMCKFCDYSDICHKGADTDRNCRTCAHSTPVEDGQWLCEKKNLIIGDKHAQLAGCGEYSQHPTIRTAP